MGTRVGFYVLEASSKTAFEVACRLAIKAWEQGQPVAIVAGSAADAAALDELMWTAPEGRFIPHNMAKLGKDNSGPIIIGSDNSENTRAEVTINLSDDPIRHCGSRILEIVRGDPEKKNRSRKKYGHYKQLGYQLETHRLN